MSIKPNPSLEAALNNSLFMAGANLVELSGRVKGCMVARKPVPPCLVDEMRRLALEALGAINSYQRALDQPPAPLVPRPAKHPSYWDRNRNLPPTPGTAPRAPRLGMADGDVLGQRDFGDESEVA